MRFKEACEGWHSGELTQVRRMAASVGPTHMPLAIRSRSVMPLLSVRGWRSNGAESDGLPPSIGLVCGGMLRRFVPPSILS